MKLQQLTDRKIKPKKELTARRMLWANYRAIEGGNLNKGNQTTEESKGDFKR